jgi:hypothetical protein
MPRRKIWAMFKKKEERRENPCQGNERKNGQVFKE